MLERLLFLLQSRGRNAKAGVLFIVLGAIVLFAILVIGLVSTLGDIALIATQARTVIDFLETGLGIFVGLAVAVFLILLGLCFLLFLASQPGDASAASASYPDPSQREQLEQLRTKLREVEHQRDEFKVENEALSKQLAAAQTQPRPEQQPASSDQPFSLEPVKRRGPQKPNGERDIYMSIRLTNEGSGSIQGCRGRLVKVQDLFSTPDGYEWQDILHIHPAYLRWSPGDGGGDSADFTTEATLDVAVIESWSEPVYQLLTANEALRSNHQLPYEQTGPFLTIEISAQSGDQIEQSLALSGHSREFLKAPTEVEPVVRWRKWP